MPKSKTGAFDPGALARANIAPPAKKKPPVRRRRPTGAVPSDPMAKLDARARELLRRNKVRKKIAVSLAYEQYAAVVEFMEQREMTLREAIDYLVRLGLRATANADAPQEDAPFGLRPANGHARPMESFRELATAGREAHGIVLETHGGRSYREAVLAAQREADAAPLRRMAQELAGMMPASVKSTPRYPMPPGPVEYVMPPSPPAYAPADEQPRLFDGEPPVGEPVLQAGETDG